MAEIQEVKTVKVDKEEQKKDSEEKGAEDETIHQLIELAGWAVELARSKTSNADVLSQLSQASVDLRQSNEALRAMNTDIPLHMKTKANRFKQIMDNIEELKAKFEKEEKESNSSD